MRIKIRFPVRICFVAISLVSCLVLSNALSVVPLTAEVSPFPIDFRNVSGLSFDGESVWITVEGDYTIYQVNPKTSRIVRKLHFPVSETGGSAWDGRYLWQLAYVEKKIYKVDVHSGEIVESLRSPGTGMCSGMTFDGTYLWVANFEDKKFYQIDQTQSGKIKSVMDGYFEATGLAWDGTYLWNGILVGTETHDEETPFTGFVQQRAINSLQPLNVVPIAGVGPGTSDWTPESSTLSRRFWWYDGFNKRIVEVNLQPKTEQLLWLGLVMLGTTIASALLTFRQP